MDDYHRCFRVAEQAREEALRADVEGEEAKQRYKRARRLLNAASASLEYKRKHTPMMDVGNLDRQHDRQPQERKRQRCGSVYDTSGQDGGGESSTGKTVPLEQNEDDCIGVGALNTTPLAVVENNNNNNEQEAGGDAMLPSLQHCIVNYLQDKDKS